MKAQIDNIKKLAANQDLEITNVSKSTILAKQHFIRNGRQVILRARTYR